MTMDDQKAFVRAYRLSVMETAEYLLDRIKDTASREEFEPDLFLGDVIRKLHELYKKEIQE